MFTNYGINKLEIWKLEEGWSVSQENKLHGNGMALSHHGMLHQNQKLFLIGGRSNKDENKNLTEIDFDVSKKFLPAVKLAYQFERAGDNPIVIRIPYGYLRECKGK